MLDRRTMIGALLGAPAWGRETLERFFDGARGTGVLLDLRGRRVLGVYRPDLAARWVVPPGSTLKPFTLSALLEAGKLRSDERFPCPGRLRIEGRKFDCSHPPIGEPMRAATAIAYSCNCFVAHFAQRFEAGELARYLVRQRLASTTGLLKESEAPGEVRPAMDIEARELQAIGEERVAVTPVGLLAAYAGLAARAAGPVLVGMEGAVEYGTAQLAAVSKVKVAGKTGTVLTRSGAHVAWFAGFAPSRGPEVAVVVAVQGVAGGTDAAPIAGRVLGDYFGGRR